MESVWKFPNGNFSSVHQITKHQHPHFQRQHEITIFCYKSKYTLLAPRSFRWHIQVMFTGRQMRLSLKIAIILWQSWPRSCIVALLFSGFVYLLFRGDGRCLLKDTCGCRFPPVFPRSFPSSFRGVWDDAWMLCCYSFWRKRLFALSQEILSRNQPGSFHFVGTLRRVILSALD